MEGSRGKGGQRGKGGPRVQPGASPRGPAPFQLCSAPPPAPPPPQGGPGKYPPPGTFRTRRAPPARSQVPGSTPGPARRRPPPPARPGTQGRGGAGASAPPSGRVRAQLRSPGAPTVPATPPTPAAPTRCLHKEAAAPGRAPRGEAPPARSPQSTHAPGPGGGVQRSRASGEASGGRGGERIAGDPRGGRSERGSPGEGRRPGPGAGGGRGPLCPRTMGRGKGAQGGAREGRGRAAADPGRDLAPRFPPPRVTLRSGSPGPRTPLLPRSPGKPRCPDTRHPQPADPGRRRVTQAPRGTWGGSSSCAEPGPPFPSPAARPHAASGPAFVAAGSRATARRWGPVQGARQEALGSQHFGGSPRPELLPALFSSRGLRRGHWEMRRKGDPAAPERRGWVRREWPPPRVARGRGGRPDTSLAPPGSGSPSSQTAA